MPTKLEEIVAATRRRVANSRRTADLRDLENRAQERTPRGFRKALETNGRNGIAIIAELKKASPSKGLIRADFNPESLASDLASAGATALSVLTDEEYFQGSLENLHIASNATKIPCLRKDFIVDEFQLLEACAYHADAILLIVAALSQTELVGLTMLGREYGLDVLCEVHDATELDRAINAGCNLIGVNSRNLHTFNVDLNTAFELAKRLPKNVISVAESGIHSGADIAKLHSAGFQAFLIGESLMKAESPGNALRTLISEASPATTH
jgi:indole-3-glycerol phosphate synthase